MDARKIAACCGLTVLALAGFLRAAEPTGFELLNSRMLSMQNHIRSMGSKLRNNVGGMNRAEGEGKPSETTPASICCSGNLEIIANDATELSALLKELASGYESASVPAGVQAVDRVKQDLGTLVGTARAFHQAPDKAKTQGAHAALTQAYLKLQEGTRALQACCPEPAPQSSNTPKKKK